MALRQSISETSRQEIVPGIIDQIVYSIRVHKILCMHFKETIISENNLTLIIIPYIDNYGCYTLPDCKVCSETMDAVRKERK